MIEFDIWSIPEEGEEPDNEDDGLNEVDCVFDKRLTIHMGDEEIIPAPTIWIVIDYPGEIGAVFTHKGGPFTRYQIYQLICKDYDHYYRNADAFKFGEYYTPQDDVVIEQIDYNQETQVVTVQVGT